MKLFKGRIIQQGQYSQHMMKRLCAEYENVKYEPGWYIAPPTIRNLMRVKRANIYKPVKIITDRSEPRGISLWDHQQDMEDFILSKMQCILAAEQRTGKTRPTVRSMIKFVQKQREKGNNSVIPVFWLAPLSGVQSVLEELDKLFKCPVGSGQGKMRLQAYLNIDLNLINYEKWREHWLSHMKMMSWEDIKLFIASCKKYARAIPQICIFDEIHKLKGYTGVQGKIARMMRPAQEAVYGSSDNFLLVGLSGTPAPNNTTDWYNILEVIAPGFLKESSPDILKERLAHIVREPDPETGEVHPRIDYWKPDEIEKFSQEISPLVLTIWKDDVLDLPPKDHIFIDLPVCAEAKQAMRFLSKMDFTAAVLRQKLRQISDGFLYESNYDAEQNLLTREVLPMPTPKEEQLRADLRTYAEGNFEWQTGKGTRVMITAGYKGTITKIREILLEEGWLVIQMTGEGWRTFDLEGKVGNKQQANLWRQAMDRSTMDDSIFPNDVKIAVLGHPKTMATGQEFSACQLMIAYSHTDDGEAEMQVLDRAHSNNMDKEQGFHIHHYCYLKYDRIIAKQLQQKKHFMAVTLADIKQAITQDLWGGQF